MRIALLDDDPQQLAALVAVLEGAYPKHGRTVSCSTFSRGESLRRALRSETFDVIVLDWGLPDMDGVDVLAWLRSDRNDATPVMMLSGRGSEHDMAMALAMGADDYVVKPFRALELWARIARMHARVFGKKDALPVVCGGWRLERASSSAIFARGPEKPGSTHTVPLTQKEFLVAQALFRNVGRAISRNHLLTCAGYSENDMTRSLDVHIHRLRQKLDMGLNGSGLRLLTIYGQGYRLEPNDVEEPPHAAEPVLSYLDHLHHTRRDDLVDLLHDER